MGKAIKYEHVLCCTFREFEFTGITKYYITMLIFDKVVEIQGLSVPLSENNIFC